MKTALECFQEAAKCEEMARNSVIEVDRLFLLDAALHWRKRGEEIAGGKVASPGGDKTASAGRKSK